MSHRVNRTRSRKEILEETPEIMKETVEVLLDIRDLLKKLVEGEERGPCVVDAL